MSGAEASLGVFLVGEDVDVGVEISRHVVGEVSWLIFLYPWWLVFMPGIQSDIDASKSMPNARFTTNSHRSRDWIYGASINRRGNRRRVH